MRNIEIIIILLLSLYIAGTSCKQKGKGSATPVKPGSGQMEELNRFMLTKEREIILNYIDRKGLVMSESPTGLWYSLKMGDSGKHFADFDRIIYDYECSLLDGTPCYSSGDAGPGDIVLGRSELAPGLNEAFRMLNPGSEALLIVPPHLGYGLKGDGKKIPARAILVYKIKVRNEE